MAKRRNNKEQLPEQVAGNGLLHRRFFAKRAAGRAAALAPRRRPERGPRHLDAEAGHGLHAYGAVALAPYHPSSQNAPPGPQSPLVMPTPDAGRHDRGGLHYERPLRHSGSVRTSTS
jgi:hypothetical protein